MDIQEQNQDISPLFLKGFNQGYYMESSNPELAEKMLEADHEQNEYWFGFEDGSMEYKLEKDPTLQRENYSKDQGFDMGR